MSKKVLVQQIQPVAGGPVFGEVSNPLDFQASQQFAHEHVEHITRDFLTGGATAAQIAGFDYTLAGGLNLSIAAGQSVTASGLSYEPDTSPSAIVMPAAHPSLPRIDLIVALLSTDAPANPQLRPFRRVRTQAELDSGVSPYSPSQYTQPTEIHNSATIAVRQGTAAASPVAPAPAANEVPLFQVTVPAGATTLLASNVADVRALIRSLRAAWTQIDANSSALSALNLNETIDDRVSALIVADSGLTKLYDDAGNLLHLGADYPVLDNRYALVSSLAESVDDRVAVLLNVPANTGLSKVYDDPNNLLTLTGIAATQAAQGMMSIADKLKLDAATASNTPSTIVLRDANGDINGRDITVARRIVFPDSSQRLTAIRKEEFIQIFELNAVPFGTNTGSYPSGWIYVGRAGVPFYINLVAEDFLNVPLCFETLQDTPSGSGIGFAQLYNVTDSVVMGESSTPWNGGVQQGRSSSFYLTGMGRKRLQVRMTTNDAPGGATQGRIYMARLVAYPQYANCGSSGNAACPI